MRQLEADKDYLVVWHGKFWQILDVKRLTYSGHYKSRHDAYKQIESTQP